VELVHQAGKLAAYIMTTGIMPLLGEIRATGADVLWGVDPQQGGADLQRVKQELADTVHLWGGVNGALTVGRGSRDEIRAAVKEACEVLGAGGGFVLFPVDAVFEDCPWENVLTYIEAGREFGGY
jgi:uroporphyrinogen decarboxylase